MSVQYISKENFESEVLHSDVPVLVDFFATWCGPCKMIAPTIDEVAAEREDVKVCKIDVDKEPELAIRYNVSSIPTLMVFSGGDVVKTSHGALPKREILAMLP